MEEHEVTSQAAHLNLLLGFMKQWKAQLGSGLGYGPIALERNLSDLQLQGAVEVAGDLEVDCYRAPCSESQEELALQHFMKEKLLTELEGKLCVFENIVAVLNKEVEASHLALAASIHQSQLDREHILRLEQRVSLGGKFTFRAVQATAPPSLAPSCLQSKWTSLPPMPSPCTDQPCPHQKSLSCVLRPRERTEAEVIVKFPHPALHFVCFSFFCNRLFPPQASHSTVGHFSCSESSLSY